MSLPCRLTTLPRTRSGNSETGSREAATGDACSVVRRGWPRGRRHLFVAPARPPSPPTGLLAHRRLGPCPEDAADLHHARGASASQRPPGEGDEASRDTTTPAPWKPLLLPQEVSVVPNRVRSLGPETPLKCFFSVRAGSISPRRSRSRYARAPTVPGRLQSAHETLPKNLHNPLNLKTFTHTTMLNSFPIRPFK